MATRLFAEWHPQDAIQLSWPSPHSDWNEMLESIEATCEAMAIAISRYQKVLISVCDEATRERLASRFASFGVPAERLHLHVAPLDDTWVRDHGPITIERDGKPVLLDYTFTGWGGKFEAARDNALTRTLAKQGIFACPVESRDFILEGGAIESDGQGTLLTTEACLLNDNRNAGLSREEVEVQLKADFGVERILWLAHGHLEGDDTDSHVDTLARFCDPRTIAYVRCDDTLDPHYSALKAMQAELEAMLDANGDPYFLVPLPWPDACFDPDDGHRLPATYANFLIINGAVLVPTYADRHDMAALKALASAFPRRDIIPVDCRAVIRQHGSLHCMTMQLPRGTLADVAVSSRQGDC